MNTPTRDDFPEREHPCNISFGSSIGILWDTSELMELEGEDVAVVEVEPNYRFGNIGSMVDPDGQTEVGMGPSYLEPERNDQMFMSVKQQRPTLLSTDSLEEPEPEEDPEDHDSFLKFAKQSGPDNDDKVKHWQSSIEGYSNDSKFEEPLPPSEETPIKRIPRMSARGRTSDSPAVSLTSESSKESPSYAPSDSTFVPDAEDLSSEESFNLGKDLPSPPSSFGRKPKKRRGRPPTMKVEPAKVTQNSFHRGKKVCGPPPVKRIKVEHVPRASAHRVPTRIQPLEQYDDDDDEFDSYYGWIYSEYNDLAPIDQIVDECISLPLDPVFYPLRPLSYCYIGDN